VECDKSCSRSRFCVWRRLAWGWSVSLSGLFRTYVWVAAALQAGLPSKGGGGGGGRVLLRGRETGGEP
jgi:hypothetical protein